MKTHIDLPKPVYQTASRMAEDQGLSLSELVIKLLDLMNHQSAHSPRFSKYRLEKIPESSDWRDELL
jgi:macrodomain Ter protein organizer (MatP/YcbG family)